MAVSETVRFRIRALNAISAEGLNRLPSEQFAVSADGDEPDALLVRSADLHALEIPSSVLAVVRAGAGTNNIPVEALSRRGIPVFNTPGANANAVKELVLAGTLLAARGIFAAGVFVRDLPGNDSEITEAVESGKRRFVGTELPGRTMGIIGMGAIGVLVANSALALGMDVVGFDPAMTVEHAWRLDSRVARAESVDDVVRRADYLTVHVPLNDHTRHLIDAQRITRMKPTAVLLNFARSEIVDERAVVDALDGGRLHGYVCDFPSTLLNRHPLVLALPHLGASTVDAEDNCARMAADELRDFLLDGNIRNSVNFPAALLPRKPGARRLIIVNENVPNVVGQVTSVVAASGLNIADLLNQSRGELAITLVDVDGSVTDELVAEIATITGVISCRLV